MRKWSEDITKAFQFSEKSKILTLLRLGFPIETSLCIRDKAGQLLVGRTYCAHLCCEYGYLDILEELVSRGCFLDSKDSFSRSPLMIACEIGRMDIVKYLAGTCKASLKGYDYQGNTILHIAAINSKIETLKYLIEDIGMNIRTPGLHKRNALETCRNLYIADYNPKLENVIGYLIAKSNRNSSSTLPQGKIFRGVYVASCHDYCKEKHYGGINSRRLGNEVRNQSQEVLEKFDAKQSPDVQNSRNSRSKIGLHYVFSVDKIVGEKCARIYKAIRNSGSQNIFNKKKSNKSILTHTAVNSSPQTTLPQINYDSKSS